MDMWSGAKGQRTRRSKARQWARARTVHTEGPGDSKPGAGLLDSREAGRQIEIRGDSQGMGWGLNLL